MERGALPGFAGGSNISLMILSYPLTHGKPDAGAAVFRLSMETLEDAEDMIGILLIKADAVVMDLDMDLLVSDTGGKGDQRRPVSAGIFEGVGDKVAEELRHLQWDGIDGGQVMVLKPAPSAFA